MQTITMEVTMDDLAEMYGALVAEHNSLLAQKKDPTRKASAQIIERQFARCLSTLVKVQLAIEANYPN